MLGNEINPLLYLLLAAVVFSAAYTGAGWSHRLLHGNDVSYGIYIYHIPVVNLLMQLGLVGAAWHVVLVLLATGVLATLSWWLVERPSLRLKRHPMNPLQPSRTG
jgi:peptidoglycan/LPS O-acetylase OafA/YrhL